MGNQNDQSDLTHLRHGFFWSLKPGQLGPNETLFFGCETRAEAEEEAAEIPPGLSPRVRRLETIEHDIPSDSPEFREELVFESERWCVICVAW